MLFRLKSLPRSHSSPFIVQQILPLAIKKHKYKNAPVRIFYLENGSYCCTGELKGPSFFGIENEADDEPVSISDAEPLIPDTQTEFNETENTDIESE